MRSLNKDSYFCYMYKVSIWAMPLVFKSHKALQWSLSFKYSIIYNMGAHAPCILDDLIAIMFFTILHIVSSGRCESSWFKKMFLNQLGKCQVVSTFLDHSFLHVSGNVRETDTNTLILCRRVWVPCLLCWNLEMYKWSFVGKSILTIKDVHFKTTHQYYYCIKWLL